VAKSDLDRLVEGITLDDGTKVHADAVSYVGDGSNKKEVGLELHTGQNRVVRRMFEALGYKVTKLDRVMFAGLTKKNVPRGKWRFLTEKEVNFLKMIPRKKKE
jgi:23S rRNA pseudouridine2605 synthase